MPMGLAIAIGATFAGIFGVLFPIAFGLAGMFTKMPTYGVLGVFGGSTVCLVVGSLLIGHGIRGLRRRSRASKLRLVDPSQPWNWDWSWDPEKAAHGSETFKMLVIFVVLLAMCAPFTSALVSFFRGSFVEKPANTPWFATAFLVLIVGFWDVITLKTGRILVEGLVRNLKFGPDRLRFDTFPFRLGGSLRGGIIANDLVGAGEMTATLRCIEESSIVVPSHGSMSGKMTTVGVFLLHSDVQRIPRPSQLNQELLVAFALPQGDYATQLSSDPFRYWELELTVSNEDPIRFLVPVY